MSRVIVPLLLIGFLYYSRSRGSSGSTNWGTYYLFWLVVPLIASALTHFPQVLLVVPVAVVLRPWLPDPVHWLQTLGRVRALESAAHANASNVTVRRDLAKLWLEQRRPARALAVLEEAMARDPKSAELHYLRGLCLLSTRAYDKAIESFVEVTHIDPGFGFGDPYLRVGDVLVAQGRWADAEDPYERFLDVQSSSVEGWYKLARVRAQRGDRDGSDKALREASSTYRALPGYHRRKQLGWHLRARLRALTG